MLYQLPIGKTIELSTEQYCELTDEELEYLIAYNYGDIQENPWFGSVLVKSPPLIIEDIPTDLIDLTEIEKFDDLDVEKDFLEE